MKSLLKSRQSSLAELNITPLLDLVFVLLVIFIIATPQLVNNLELALPSGKTPDSAATEALRVLVLGRDRIRLDAREWSREEFKAEIARRKAARPELSVVVDGQGQVVYQAVIDVLEILRSLGVAQTGLEAGG